MAPAEKGEKSKWFELTTAQVMEVIGVSRMSLTNFSDLGMPKLSHGKYDVRAVVQWYVTRKQTEFDKRMSNLGTEEAEKRYRLAKAESAELDLAVKRGELVPVEKVLEMWETHVGAAKVKMLALPARFAVPLTAARTAQETQAILYEGVLESLNELTAISGAPNRRGVAGVHGRKTPADVADAKKTKAIRVGRRKSVHPSRRKSDRARKVADVPG